jgi:hypothetical protein
MRMCPTSLLGVRCPEDIGQKGRLSVLYFSRRCKGLR